MAAGPAIILAQALALFVVLPVFGKAKKKNGANSINSSVELMASTRNLSKSVTLTSYIHCRFRSASLDVLVAVLVFALWTFISVSSFKSFILLLHFIYVCTKKEGRSIWIVKATIHSVEISNFSATKFLREINFAILANFEPFRQKVGISILQNFNHEKVQKFQKTLNFERQNLSK